MENLFKETAENIREIRDLVEHDVLNEEKYPLDSFRYNSGFIMDLLKELDDCSASAQEKDL